MLALPYLMVAVGVLAYGPNTRFSCLFDEL
jgi:hypothetical protein